MASIPIGRFGGAALVAAALWGALVGAAAAQPASDGAACETPAAHCGAEIAPSCLQRIGAGALPASGDCGDQFQRYTACLAEVAERCGGRTRPTAAAGGACDAETAAVLWEDVKASDDCLAYQSYLDACPEAPQARIASARLARLSCAADEATPSPQDAAASFTPEALAVQRNVGGLSGPAVLGVIDPPGGPVASLALAPQGGRAASISLDGEAYLWGLDEGGAVALDAQGFDATAIAFSPSGRNVALARQDGALQIHDAATGERLLRWAEQPAKVIAAAFRGEEAVVVATVFAELFLLDVPTETARLLVQFPFVADRAAFSVKGDAVAFIDKRQRAHAARESGGAQSTRLDAPTASPSVVSLAPDGRHVAVGADDGALGYYDIESGRLLSLAEPGGERGQSGHAAPITSVAFDASGFHGASADASGAVVVRLSGSGRVLRALPTAPSGAAAIAFSADGRRLLIADGAGAVSIVDVEALK